MCSVYVHNIIRLFKSLHDESRPHPENWIERKGAGVLANQSRLGSNLAVLGHMDLSLGRSCSGSKLKLRHLGAKLGRSLSQVGASWAEVGALLAKVDPQVGPMLRPCRIETVHLDDFGPICKMCKLPVPCTFWRPALSKMPPPS